MKVDRNLIRASVFSGLILLPGCITSQNSEQVPSTWETRTPGDSSIQIYRFREGYEITNYLQAGSPFAFEEESSDYNSISENYIGCVAYHGSLMCAGGLDVPNGYVGVELTLGNRIYSWNPREEAISYPVKEFEGRAVTGIPTWTAVDKTGQMVAITFVPSVVDIGQTDRYIIPLGKAIPAQPGITPAPLAP